MLIHHPIIFKKSRVVLGKENTSINKKNQFKNQESRKLPFLIRVANSIKISISLDDIRPDSLQQTEEVFIFD